MLFMRKFTPSNKEATYVASCTLDRIRTCGLLIRSQLLYPAELRGHCIIYVREIENQNPLLKGIKNLCDT